MALKYLHTGLVADPICKLHATPWGHPECPERYDAIFQGLSRSGLLDLVEKIACRPASDAELLRCHTAAYLTLLREETESGAAHLSTGDTDVCPRSLEAALYAAGGALQAVDAVLEGRVKNAFSAMRPPGHHATASRGMGFCLLNNVALAARHAQVRHGLERVLIVDWDVHHGNGTQDLFYEDPGVFYFSLHQWPLYPGTGAREETGAGAGVGTTLNVPLNPGAGRREVLDAFRDELTPAMQTFKPQLVLISAGFDSRAGDPLGSLLLTDDDFEDLTHHVLTLAKEHAEGRLISLLEGGYNLPGLASAVVRHVQALADA